LTVFFVKPGCDKDSMSRLNYEKSHTMNQKSNEPTKNELRIEIRHVELETATVELQKRLAEIQAAVRRLEKAKTVSQETMNLEVSV